MARWAVIVLATVALAFSEDASFDFSTEWNATFVAVGLRIISSQAEEQSGVAMMVEGILPLWLKGRYYRNGPGQFQVDKSPGV